MRCEDWPATLTATVEFYDTYCGACTVVVTLDKQGCEGETIYTADDATCTADVGAEGANSIAFLELVCSNNSDQCGTPEDPLADPIFEFSDEVSRATATLYVLDLETACCDPLFLEFTIDHPSYCVPFGMGAPNGKIRVTITA